MRLVARHLLLLALFAAPLRGSAQAMDYEVGTSLVCDTQSQAERFAALFSEDAQAAVDAVNAEEQNPTAADAHSRSASGRRGRTPHRCVPS
jgi:hypothetical protein